ncbi:BMP family lipoprotein [Propionigenium maris]|uniref:BMP family lipoprotein n=1 Tax=Propionigenium maris TaxID=45622 RepID=UPI00248FB565|nr:BMP family ABC transporter substrate-binding protein [Propionigenium maris]
MKKIVVLLVCLLLFAACKKENTVEHKKRVGVVFSVGGLGDHSFNDSTNEGIKAVEAQGVIVKRVEPANPSEDEMYLREFAENNFDVVVGIGFLMEDSLKKVAMEYPEQKFMGIDMNLDLPNVKSLIFHEKQGSFLVGALAAMVSEGRPVGFVGAAQSPMINAMGEGFAEGARYVDPQIEVVSSYTPGPNPFNDPARGYEIATSMIETQEVEVIYHAAGGTGLGVFQASKEKGTYAIGVDTDQDGFEPGTVITSMIKSLDRVAERELNTILSGDFEAGIEMQNLENGGVRITETPFELGVIGDEKRFREIQEKLISGEIVVEDYRK